MARTDYYDHDGKFLGSVGSGSPAARRIMPASDFRRIAINNMPKPGDFLKYEIPGAGQGVASIPANTMTTPASLDRQLRDGSKELAIQRNRSAFVAQLVAAAQRTGREQGAYIVLQYSKSNLFFSPAPPVSSSATHFSFSVSRHGNLRLVPTDYTLQIIGTIHTHYADVAAMDAARPGVRHSIAPQVSPLDRSSAKSEKFIVYAIDANFVHKACPNGQVRNKLPRNLDILIDALESYGKA